MVGIRKILGRRRAVSNICRLTRTMQVVSTAMFKSYHNKWLAVTKYHDALAQAGYLLVTSETPMEHPLLGENSSGRSAVLAISSRAGLCGPYNSSIYKMLETHLNLAKSTGKNLDIYATTGRLSNILYSHGVTPKKIFGNLDEIPSDAQIHEIADYFIDYYMVGLLDSFVVLYMAFHSPGHQQAQTRTIMPFTELIDDLTTRAKVIWPWDLVFEDFYMWPSPKAIIEGLARMIMHATIKDCFLQAALSEHTARMIAMRNATKNAEDMIRDLTNQYNQARQTQITSELLDIISGTGDLK